MTALAPNIVRGDTLSKSPSATHQRRRVMARNRNPRSDLIYAGTRSPSARHPPRGERRPGGGRRPSTPWGNNAAALPRSSAAMPRAEYSDDLPWPTGANNVTGQLRLRVPAEAGLIDAARPVLVDQLATTSGGRWARSLADANRDVVLMQRDGQSHVVLFAGFEGGQPRFIGSNNINPDGSQQVSWGGASGNYEIISPRG